MRQVVKQGVTFVKKERQIILCALRSAPLTDLVKHTALFRIAIKTAIPVDLKSLINIRIENNGGRASGPHLRQTTQHLLWNLPSQESIQSVRY